MLIATATAPLRSRIHSRASTLSETEFYSTLVKDLRSRRQNLGLTQLDVAMKVGVSDYLVTKWENLLKIPTAYGLMCWCQALGVQLSVLHDAD